MQPRDDSAAQRDPSPDVEKRAAAPLDSTHRNPPAAAVSDGNGRKPGHWIDCSDHAKSDEHRAGAVRGGRQISSRGRH
jgi:hypothetical protein